jgi:hypothetical protein
VLRVLKALCLVVVAFLVAPLPAASAAPVQSVFAVVVTDALVAPVAGQSVAFDTTLMAGNDRIGNVTVSLEIRPYGASAFSTARTTRTDSAGHAAVSLVLTRTTAYRWTFPGVQDMYDPTTSPVTVRFVAPRVRAHARDRTLHRGQRLIVRGKTYPAKAGCRVVLLRGRVQPLTAGPRPVRLARATVRDDGSYRLVRRFHKKMKMRVVVKVASCAGNEAGYSPYLRVRVR